MTPYVLSEQGDWFEDEIRFVRRLVEADTVFVDVGANYGVYALSVARLAPAGQVWAYEPCGATADCLEEGVRANGFANVRVIRKALSDHAGEGRLATHDNPELNALVDAPATSGETVTLTTLDAERAAHGWSRIDLMKIDAEGHEAQVIDGGRGLFAGTSPLIMLEIKAGTQVELAPVRRLAGFGYETYRLVPGLCALVPQDPAAGVDPFQLNVFCCRPDRAAALVARGRLVTAAGLDAPTTEPAAGAGRALLADLPALVEVTAWRTPSQGAIPEAWRRHEAALDLYALSRSASADVAVRYAALRRAAALLAELNQRRSNLPRLLSWARVAADLGARGDAVRALQMVLAAIGSRHGELVSGEPFLPASAQFEAIPPGPRSPAQWGFASALFAWECLRSHSGYFAPPEATLRVAAELDRLGFHPPQMAERARLARSRQPEA